MRHWQHHRVYVHILRKVKKIETRGGKSKSKTLRSVYVCISEFPQGKTRKGGETTAIGKELSKRRENIR